MIRPGLETRVDALESAIEAGQSRLQPEIIADADQTLRKVKERMQLSQEHTVVALAGGTGAGKSALFNRLVGADLALEGTQRPTTSFPLAVVVEGVEESKDVAALLQWLEVRESLELQPDKDRPSGLVLLDLPDQDSIELSHRLRSDRVTERADLLVWITNPQKYADGVLHNEYLQKMRSDGQTTLVVLNQVDRLSAREASTVLEDLSKLVSNDGLKARVIGTSAVTGAGVEKLRASIAEAVKRREAATLRMVGEVRSAAKTILTVVPETDVSLSELRDARKQLLSSMENAAGVPLVVDAVYRSSIRDAGLKTGWPPLRWLSKLRADPLRTLGLKTAAETRRQDSDPIGVTRSSLPTSSAAVTSQMRTAARHFVEVATAGLPSGTAQKLSLATNESIGNIADHLDSEVTRTVQVSRPRWWQLANWIQWFFLAGAVVGALWLAGVGLLDYLRMPSEFLVPSLSVGRLEIPWPSLLLIVGIGAGLILALVGGALGRIGAQRQATRVRKQLRSGVEAAADSEIFNPIDTELAAISTVRVAATRAAA